MPLGFIFVKKKAETLGFKHTILFSTELTIFDILSLECLTLLKI